MNCIKFSNQINIINKLIQFHHTAYIKLYCNIFYKMFCMYLDSIWIYIGNTTQFMLRFYVKIIRFWEYDWLKEDIYVLITHNILMVNLYFSNWISIWTQLKISFHVCYLPFLFHLVYGNKYFSTLRY